MLNSVKNHFRFLVLPQMKKTCFGDFRQMKKYLWLYPVRAEQTLSRGGGWEIFFYLREDRNKFYSNIIIVFYEKSQKGKGSILRSYPVPSSLPFTSLQPRT